MLTSLRKRFESETRRPQCADLEGSREQDEGPQREPQLLWEAPRPRGLFGEQWALIVSVERRGGMWERVRESAPARPPRGHSAALAEEAGRGAQRKFYTPALAPPAALVLVGTPDLSCARVRMGRSDLAPGVGGGEGCPLRRQPAEGP